MAGNEPELEGLRADHSVRSILNDLATRDEATGLPPAPTGFDPLDLALDGGLLPQELVLLGGRPGVGKTLTALQWARASAASNRHVAFVCYEHDEVALIGRLIIQEIAATESVDSTLMISLRSHVRMLMTGQTSLNQLADAHPVLKAAINSLYDNAEALSVIRASTLWSDINWLEQVATDHLEPGGLLVVDYIQKIPVQGAPNLHHQVMRATEHLKDLAVTANIAVLALAAADEVGISARRLRLDHLRGADALAHECDIAMILNQKVDATADRHLRYDLLKMEEAKTKVLLSIEKNRRGENDIHLEFVKDFGSFRLRPNGGFNSDGLYELDQIPLDH